MRLRLPSFSRIRRALLYSLVGVGIVVFLGKVVLPHLVPDIPMEDALMETAVSPDGKYVAKRFYRDGLTYGYGHITLGTHDLHSSHNEQTDLAEVAAEGLREVRWQDARTLIVEYDNTKHQDSLADTSFVTQQKTWRDVNVVYLPAQ